MDPVSSLSLMVGASLMVYSVSATGVKLKQSALRRSRMLPNIMAKPQFHDADAELLLLAVHIRTASLLARLDGEDLKIRVKHGDAGVSAVCDTMCVRAGRSLPPFRTSQASKPVAADFDTTCIFLWQGDPDSSLRIRLVKPSSGLGTLAKASILLPWESSTLQEFDVQLAEPARPFSASSSNVGCVSIAVEMLKMSKSDLQRHLEDFRAQRRQGAFVLAEGPVVLGEVTDPEDSTDETMDEAETVLHGAPIAE